MGRHSSSVRRKKCSWANRPQVLHVALLPYITLHLVVLTPDCNSNSTISSRYVGDSRELLEWDHRDWWSNEDKVNREPLSLFYSSTSTRTQVHCICMSSLLETLGCILKVRKIYWDKKICRVMYGRYPVAYTDTPHKHPEVEVWWHSFNLATGLKSKNNNVF